MANKNFYVHNGLTVGNLTVDAATGNLITSGVSTITNASAASSTVTGALQVVGGVGVGGRIYAGDDIYSKSNLVLTTANIPTYAVTTVAAGTDTAVSQTGGTATVWNTSTLQTITSRGATTNQIIQITNATDTNTSTNGALQVSGGVGIQKNLMVGGNAQIWGQTTFAGSVIFNGTSTFVYSTNTYYTDNLINLHLPQTGVGTQWTFDDGKDIGLVYHYYNRTTNTDTNAALVLSNESQFLEWYSAGSENSQGDFTGTIVYGTFKTGSIVLTNTSTGTSGGAGALQVAGGIYAGGSSYIGGNLTVAGTINATISGTTAQANNLNGGSTGTLVYQSAANSSAFLTPGAAGAVLISNGANTVPSYVAQSTLSVGTATRVSVTANNGAGPNYIAFFNTTTGASTPLVDTDFTYNASTNILTAGQFSGSGAGLNSIPNSALNNSSITITSGNGIATNPSNGVVSLGSSITVENIGVTRFLGGTTGLTSTNQTGTVTLTGTLGVANGGTNNTALGAVGTLVYSDGTRFAFLNSGTTGFVLVQGNNTATWTNANILSAGTATNIAGGAANQLLFQTGAGATGFVATPTTVGHLLQWNGTNIVWASTSSLFAGNAFTATNLGAGAAGQIPIQSGANTTVFIPTGSSGQLLQAGTNTATFVNTTSIVVGGAGTSTNLAGGVAGLIPIQSAANQTAFINSGSVGTILVQGTNTATWQNTSTLIVGFAGTATNNSGGAAGQIQIQTGPGQTAFIPAPAATGQLLLSGSTSTASFVNTSSIAVASASTATHIAGGAAGQMQIQSSPGQTAFIPVGSTGHVLIYGTNTATWNNATVLSVGTATNLAGGAVNQLHVQTSTGTSGFITAPTVSGQLLQWNGSNIVWASTGSLIAGIATTASNLAAGTAGQLVYQIAPGQTGYTGPGTAGQVLVSGGTGAPVYQSTLTLVGTVAATTTQTGALQVRGGVGIGGNMVVGGNIVLNSTSSAIVQSDPGYIVGTSPVIIDSFSTSTFRSAKYIISVANPITNLYQTTEALVIHNGIEAYIQEASVVSTSTFNLMMDFDATISAGNVVLTATGVANTNTVKVQCFYIEI
jgi:hypothetical protein